MLPSPSKQLCKWVFLASTSCSKYRGNNDARDTRKQRRECQIKRFEIYTKFTLYTLCVCMQRVLTPWPVVLITTYGLSETCGFQTGRMTELDRTNVCEDFRFFFFCFVNVSKLRNHGPGAENCAGARFMCWEPSFPRKSNKSFVHLTETDLFRPGFWHFNFNGRPQCKMYPTIVLRTRILHAYCPYNHFCFLIN